MFYLSAYQRLPEGDAYSASLAGSVHFRYSRDGIHYAPLNQNYGMLFPTSEINPDNTINPRAIKNPRLFQKGDTYGIAATYTDLQGKNAAGGKLYFWETTDFLRFQEIGLVEEASFGAWTEAPNATITLPDEAGREIIDAWVPLTAASVSLPAGLTLQKPEELWQVTALMEYSDGSLDEKRVDWEVPEKDLLPDGTFAPGMHQLHGLLHKDSLPFPLAVGYADPVLLFWEGNWYFLATNDNLNDIGMFVRRAKTIDGLFDGSATERCILSYRPDKNWIQTFWAPEFHQIGGELYILFTVSGREWSPQCHMMKLKKNGDILNPEAWEEPVRVIKQDGTPLATDGICLDITHFSANGTDYLVWSYRFGIGTPRDSGSMLYIATTSPQKPWQLTSEPVLLSRPLYGWEHTIGTINNEGPYALLSDGRVYLAYSGGSANGYSYVVGYLIADQTADLLNPAVWTKTPCPAMSSYSVGIDGPGHNSFFVSEDGKTMLAFHGQLSVRCSALQRVHFNKRGFPLLNMSPERDIPEALRPVTILFETKNP